jgi:NAD(P)-dependent dehydrogenase (short-subunit alcohol dehydrogenase family)
LVAGGWTVFAGVRDPAAGERLLQEAVAGQVIPLTLDVTDAGQIEQARVRVQEETARVGGLQGGRLDALVNNAGIGVGGPLELVSPEDLRMQFEVNVFGQVAVTRALLPALRVARGRIVLISSIGGRVSVPFNGPYAASKHAIEALGDALRGELHSSNIRVSLVEPGSVKTPIWDKARATADGLEVPPELQDEYGRVQAAFAKVLTDTERRAVSPEQVAATIERALTARRPRARYLIGRDARGMVLAHALLPSGAFDSVLRRVLGV